MEISDMETLEMLKTYLDYYYGNILISDGEGKILYVNDTLPKMYGITREKALSMTVYDLVDEGVLDRSAVMAVLKTGKEAMIKLGINSSGAKIDCVAKPVYVDGKLKYIIAFSHDEIFMDEMEKELRLEKEKRMDIKDTLLFIQQANNRYSQIITADAKMKNIFESMKYMAQTDSTIIIYGESGVGKDVLANFIHSNSKRAQEVFMPVNCSAIPSELMESEFFGYEKGAFTGADRNGKKGIFEMSNGGTVFLDEIGDLTPMTQAKLLRFLDSGEIKRVGATEIIYSDVRIIAATNKDLSKMVREGSFREDLYYRLNIIPVHIPPLRERPADIEALTDHYIKEYNQKYNHSVRFTSEQRKRIAEYNWPGNIRELRNEIERYVITDGRTNILAVMDSQALPPEGKTEKISAYTDDLRSAKDRFEKEYIIGALEECDWKIGKTAERLGIHRSVLYTKMEKYNIKR
ncbi:MAG: sigma 54-interacting transcriptional regulator [Clostridiales bacterium]|nr:sigma 54-interacting transcriptional regulator [Clostridiales bacterium]